MNTIGLIGILVKFTRKTGGRGMQLYSRVCSLLRAKVECRVEGVFVCVLCLTLCVVSVNLSLSSSNCAVSSLHLILLALNSLWLCLKSPFRLASSSSFSLMCDSFNSTVCSSPPTLLRISTS